MAVKKTANIRQILTRRCARLGIPVSGTFELTPRCNLRCKMCYVRLTPEQMAPIGKEKTAREWIELAQQAKDAGMTFLLITGGEPTLRSDFCEIYEALAQMGFSISINTNGTLLSPALRELWRRLPPSQVNITLYGTSHQDYELLCGNADAFDAVLSGLQWLKSEKILTRLNATMVPENQSNWIEYESFAQKQGLDLRMTTYCFPPKRREICTKCDEFARLCAEDAAELALLDLIYQEGPAAIAARAAGLTSNRDSSCSLDIGEPMKCMAGRSQFWVNWDGSMTPCGMLVTPMVRPFDGSFAEAWEQLKAAVSEIRLCPDCVDCPDQDFCRNCAAVTYTETGKFDGKPEYMCQFSKAYRAKLNEIVEKL